MNKRISILFALVWIVNISFSIFPAKDFSTRRIRNLDFHLLSYQEVSKMGYSDIPEDAWYVLHNGGMYIVKNAVTEGEEISESDFPEKELFIYNLYRRCFEGRQNLAEVILVKQQEIKSTSLGAWMQRYDFTKALLSRLAQEYQSSPVSKNGFWREELIAFLVFVRDFDHDVFIPHSNFFIFKRGLKKYGVCYDYGQALLVDPSSDFVEYLEDTSVLVYLLNHPGISYSAIAGFAERVNLISDEEIRDLALKSGIEDEDGLKYIADYLSYTRRHIFADLEHLIYSVRGRRVNLSGYLNGN